MKVYLDYVFLVNFLFDFILLLGVSIVLKRRCLKTRFILGSVFGGISSFIVFLQISSFAFFIFKLLFGFIMVIITFSFKNLKYTMNNYIYLVILSILLGGSLYLLNIEIDKTLFGKIVLSSNTIYIVLLLITSFIVIIFYSRYIKKSRNVEAQKYKVMFSINNDEYNLIGYLDTGNNLMFKKRPVVIINKDISLNIKHKKVYNLMCSTINGISIMKCIKLNEFFIEGKCFKNIYLGISNDKFSLKDADIILNINLWEDIDERKNIEIDKKDNR